MVEWDGDAIFKYLTFAFAFSIILLFAIVLIQIVVDSIPALSKFGIGFFTRDVWDPLNGEFSALPFIFGTFFTATLALLVSYILSISIAFALTELIPKTLSEYLSALVDLIAAIPSVVIGLWGIFYLIPVIRDSMYPILKPLSFIPLFQGTTQGSSYLAATLVLIFMITPIEVSIFKEAFLNVPRDLKEAMYALGATRSEVVRKVIIPNTKSALLAGIILAYGRALGETLAVTMVVGNKPNITLSLLAPGYTLASVIANEFLEATNTIYISSLISLGLILLLISFAVNLVGYLIQRGARM